MIEPSTLSCAHTFCVRCISNALKTRRSCPNCATEVAATFLPEVNQELKKLIKELNPEAFAARLELLSDEPPPSK